MKRARSRYRQKYFNDFKFVKEAIQVKFAFCSFQRINLRFFQKLNQSTHENDDDNESGFSKIDELLRLNERMQAASDFSLSGDRYFIS